MPMVPVLTRNSLQEILDYCTFHDWAWLITEEENAFTVQAVFPACDSQSLAQTVERGRKWRVSRFSTKGEIVQTVLKAVLTAVEHETRENFLYKGQAIFGPHFDPDELHALATNGLRDTRSLAP